jgi:hypothetical protein
MWLLWPAVQAAPSLVWVDPCLCVDGSMFMVGMQCGSPLCEWCVFPVLNKAVAPPQMVSLFLSWWRLVEANGHLAWDLEQLHFQCWLLCVGAAHFHNGSSHPCKAWAPSPCILPLVQGAQVATWPMCRPQTLAYLAGSYALF